MNFTQTNHNQGDVVNSIDQPEKSQTEQKKEIATRFEEWCKKHELGINAGMLVASPLLAAYTAFVMSTTWGWFVVPLFNLPPMPLITGLGLLVFVGLFRRHRVDERSIVQIYERGEETTAFKLAKFVIFGLILPTCVLVQSWFLHVLQSWCQG